jgi:hypothetical protein
VAVVKVQVWYSHVVIFSFASLTPTLN